MSEKNEISSNKNSSIADLKLVTDVFQRIETETAEIAEFIFDYLIDLDDEYLITGTIPPIEEFDDIGNKNTRINKQEKRRINAYIRILNRLFLFSRKGGLKIISRKVIQDLDKKTFAICMCHDGGVSLDILCDIVNVENEARTPKTKIVKVTITQAFSKELAKQNTSLINPK